MSVRYDFSAGWDALVLKARALPVERLLEEALPPAPGLEPERYGDLAVLLAEARQMPPRPRSERAVRRELQRARVRSFTRRQMAVGRAVLERAEVGRG